MSKQFIAVIIIVILGLFGVFAMTKKSSDDQQSSSGSEAKTSEHKKGAGNKGVTLIEYGDFQCPACKSYYPMVKQIKESYGDDITFQFRHFPLTQIHPHAFAASRAAEAAGKQDKFFDMHDMLYENQDSWTSQSNVTTIFEGYAQQLGLNMEQFKADVLNAETAAVINADLKAGNAIGASSTPTFVLNGSKIENPQSFDEFKKLIDDEIAKSNKQ
ncbi:MAG TPA: thioredoxin domain-containing protein [Patescibacteria group bacterium]|nr:thioredoxin domain-containing protein [Patescibacteria group bacterium]